MSLYAEYIKEREGLECYEDENSFCTYSFSPNGKELHIHDIFVTKHFRRSKKASKIVDELSDLGAKKGALILVGYYDVRTKGWETSKTAQEAYGFKRAGMTEDGRVYMIKEIQ